MLIIALLPNAAAQTSDQIRDPEVLSPTAPKKQPCIVDQAALNDPRMDRNVLRAMQTEPYFALNDRSRVTRFVTIATTKWGTDTVEFKFKSIGCGFKTQQMLLTHREKNGSVSSTSVTSSLVGPQEEALFSETNYRYPNKTTNDWQKLTSLRTTGSPVPVRLQNRYSMSRIIQFSFGSVSYLHRCEVTERRSASEFYSRFVGEAFITKCQNETITQNGSKRDLSTLTSVSFPDIDSGFSFEPDKCQLEMRRSSEFHRNLHGEAFVTRCRNSLNWVYFPEIGQMFSVDSIDGSFRANADQREILAEVEFEN